MRTGNNIKRIADRFTPDDLDMSLPFWRILKNDQTLLKFNNYEGWATVIENEGFLLSYTKSGKVKVNFDAESVFSF